MAFEQLMAEAAVKKGKDDKKDDKKDGKKAKKEEASTSNHPHLHHASHSPNKNTESGKSL